MDTAIERAINAAGSLAELARLTGVSYQAIQQWRQIPPKHVLKIEEATGISRHVLRPDIFGEEGEAA